jgi:hypothetical protein
VWGHEGRLAFLAAARFVDVAPFCGPRPFHGDFVPVRGMSGPSEGREAGGRGRKGDRSVGEVRGGAMLRKGGKETRPMCVSRSCENEKKKEIRGSN